MGLNLLVFSKVLLLVLMVKFIKHACSQGVVNVKDYGAVGDGKTDNTNVSFNDLAAN